MKVISIVNNKGGVGKSTTAVNVAVGLGLKEKRCLLVDFDPQANSTDYFIDQANKISGYTFIDEMIEGIETRVYPTQYKNVDFIPSRLDLFLSEERMRAGTKAQHNRLLKIIKQLDKDYDFIIIDCSTVLNLLMVNVLNVSDEVIIPIKIDLGAEKGFEFTKKSMQDIAESYDLEIDYKVLFTMVNRNNTDKERMQEIKEKEGNRVINSTIRFQAKPVTNGGYDQVAVVAGKTNVGNDYNKLVEELLSSWEEK